MPPDLMRMIEQENKSIEPHQELVDLVNLGDVKNRKEVRMGTSLSSEDRQQLTDLL